MTKNELMELIEEDYYSGNMFQDSNSTLGFIRDLINRLEEEQVNSIAVEYGYFE